MSSKIKYKDIPIGLAVSVRTQTHTGGWRSFMPVVETIKKNGMDSRNNGLGQDRT